MRYNSQLDKYVPTNVNKMIPILPITVAIDLENYERLGGVVTSAVSKSCLEKESVGDTGAAICCAPPSEIDRLGLKIEDLLQSDLNLLTADRRKLEILGCVPVDIATTAEDGCRVTIKDMLYFVKVLQAVFLSRDALSAMGSITKCFPKVRAGAANVIGAEIASMDHDGKCIVQEEFTGDTAICGCPVRTKTPEQ